MLELYLTLYRRVAGNGTYIDAFAGKGSVAISGQDQERKGSARIAVDSGAFKHLVFIELDAATCADLRHNLAYHYTVRKRNRIKVFEDDANTKLIELLDAEAIPKDKPCFAFLDPNSTQLDWITVERLARYKHPADPPKACKIELWVLFNTHQAFGRLVDRKGITNYAESGRAKTLDRVMGGRDAWWDLFEAGAHINAYARRYADRLRDELHYGFAHAQLVKDPETGAPQYFMIHASDHPAAWDFMRWAKRESCYFDNTERLPGFEV